MEKLSKVLDQVIKYNKANNEDPEEVKLCGTGAFAVVFDLGENVFKLTRESSYKEIANSQNIINNLAESGVNTPKTYMIEDYLVSNVKILINTLVSGCKASTLPEILPDIIEEQSNKKERITGMFQEKIEGTCLQELKLYYKQFQDLILSSSNEHLYKFVMDAKKLLENNIRIDNSNLGNFIYNKNRGFFFIDLDFIQNEELDSPFDYTLENIVFLGINVYTNLRRCPERINQTFELYFKLFDVAKEVYLKNLNNEKLKQQSKFFLKGEFYNRGVSLYKNREKFSVKDQYKQKMKDVLKYIDELTIEQEIQL